MTIQQTSSTTTARTLYVAGERGRRHALAQLRAEFGGIWAYGVGNAYPEDYTALERSRIESVVYCNTDGRRTLVARIVMLPPTACATCDQPLDHHPLCLLHRRPAAWCDCGAATAHMVESERHRWTARPGERCPPRTRGGRGAGARRWRGAAPLPLLRLPGRHAARVLLLRVTATTRAIPAARGYATAMPRAGRIPAPPLNASAATTARSAGSGPLDADEQPSLNDTLWQPE